MQILIHAQGEPQPNFDVFYIPNAYFDFIERNKSFLQKSFCVKLTLNTRESSLTITAKDKGYVPIQTVVEVIQNRLQFRLQEEPLTTKVYKLEKGDKLPRIRGLGYCFSKTQDKVRIQGPKHLIRRQIKKWASVNSRRFKELQQKREFTIGEGIRIGGVPGCIQRFIHKTKRWRVKLYNGEIRKLSYDQLIEEISRACFKLPELYIIKLRKEKCVKTLKDDFNVQLVLPKNADDRIITLHGKPEQLKKATAFLEFFVKHKLKFAATTKLVTAIFSSLSDSDVKTFAEFSCLGQIEHLGCGIYWPKKGEMTVRVEGTKESISELKDWWSDFVRRDIQEDQIIQSLDDLDLAEERKI